MADVLSQSEVESLLAALDPGSAQTTPANAGDAANAQISVYDFKRPERVSKEAHALQCVGVGLASPLTPGS